MAATILMAVVAGFRAIAVPSHTAVLIIGLRLLVCGRRVAVNTGET